MRVVFTPLAERQLEGFHRYIAERSGDDRADGYIGRIVSFCQNLGSFPIRGASRNDLLPGLRTIGFERRATIAFMVEPDLVLIEGVFYGGQDYEAAFIDWSLTPPCASAAPRRRSPRSSAARSRPA